MKKTQFYNWKAWGLVAATLAFGTCLRAGGSPSAPSDLPSVVIMATDPTALEGTSSGAFTLLRYGPSTNDLKVNLAISGTASNGVDYAQTTNETTIPTGLLAVDIPINPLIDTMRRGNKTVVFTIVTNGNYSLGSGHKATVTIIDDIFNVLPPSITLTNPVDGAIFTNPPSITLQVDAGDADVAITSVSYYANDDFIGRSSTSPFSLVWTNPTSGKIALFARAVDSVGQSTISAPVHIQVVDTLPSVVLTSPTNGQNFMVHDDISIQADVTDADSSAVISKVSFYANSHLLGVATNAPYKFDWTDVPAGLYYLRAVATDQNGLKGYSSTVVINVSRF